jgi:glycosyltransferase involved in cell wall biosynthesis
LEKTNNSKFGLNIYSGNTKNVPLVSVIVTTKNEEKNIEHCLQSIKNQTFKNIELIVVDNFSQDQTAEFAKKCSAKVYFKGNERSAQRNYGAKVALGKYLIYLDADMILSPHVIEECVITCEGDRVGALYVPERIVGEGFWIKIRDFERSFYTGTVIDAVRFIRKDLFEKIGGFDESLIGPEDWDLDRRIKEITQVDVIGSALYHNEGRFNLKKYLGKKEYYLQSFENYVRKWGNDDPVIKKQIGLSYRLSGVFIENGKWKRLLTNPTKTLGMFYLRFMVGISYLRS